MSKKLTTLTKSINKLVSNMEQNIPAVAYALYNAKNIIDWKDTNYGSWRAFCKSNLPFPYTDTYRYVSAAEHAIKVCDMSLDAVRFIVDDIGWTRFSICVHFETHPVSISEFVRKHRYYDVDAKPPQIPSGDTLEHFSFQLTKEDAEALTSLLLERGMRLSNASRVNASVAMAKLVKDVRKD